MKAPSEDDVFNTEVVKLLLQVAWSDDAVDSRERDLILGAGRSWGVPEPVLQVLMDHLARGEPLPQPNLAMLRKRPDDVLMAARGLVLVDGVVHEEETQMLKQITQLLGLTKP
jgi:uncharacterized membrane protein YebE (DUF533 family)